MRNLQDYSCKYYISIYNIIIILYFLLNYPKIINYLLNNC